MDKRWIYILIIFIVGMACLYLIVDSSSSTLGKASLKISGCDITVPSSMNVEASGGKYIYLFNKQNTEKIGLRGNDKGNCLDENYTSELNLLKENESVVDMQFTNITIGNDTLPTICYQTVDNDTFNQISFLYKCNRTFIIKSTGYADNATLKNDLNTIVESMRIDYKQKQD